MSYRRILKAWPYLGPGGAALMVTTFLMVTRIKGDWYYFPLTVTLTTISLAMLLVFCDGAAQWSESDA